MSDAAITGGEEKPTPPATPNPAATAVTGNVVTLTKEEHDKLIKAQTDLESARALQAQADKRAARFEKLIGRKGNSPFAKSAAPAAAPTPEELDTQGIEEDRKAERGLIAIAVDPKYREILDTDQTLRNLLTSNPLGILPIIAPQAFDAEDAIELVKEHLDTRLLAFKKTPPAIPPATLPTPPIGGVNLNDKPVDENVEAARKLPNTERAIAGMIGARLKALAGKK